MRLGSFDPFRTLGIPGVRHVKPADWFAAKDVVRDADWVLFPEHWQVGVLTHVWRKAIFPSASAPLRRRAVLLLGQKRDAGLDEILVDVVRNDPDPEVRAVVVADAGVVLLHVAVVQRPLEPVAQQRPQLLAAAPDAVRRQVPFFSTDVHKIESLAKLRDYLFA
mgnify:CR=1 FL=1